jgi:hypothetical protein
MLRKMLAEQDSRTGFVPDPAATALKGREMMLAAGVRPEDNEFSRDIIGRRDPEFEP